MGSARESRLRSSRGDGEQVSTLRYGRHHQQNRAMAAACCAQNNVDMMMQTIRYPKPYPRKEVDATQCRPLNIRLMLKVRKDDATRVATDRNGCAGGQSCGGLEETWKTEPLITSTHLSDGRSKRCHDGKWPLILSLGASSSGRRPTTMIFRDFPVSVGSIGAVSELWLMM